MKAMIQLAIVCIMMLTSCKKDELEDIKPVNTSGQGTAEPAKISKNSQNPDQVNFDPLNPNKKHY